MVKEGAKAPGFTLESTEGGEVNLKDFAGKTVVFTGTLERRSREDAEANATLAAYIRAQLLACLSSSAPKVLHRNASTISFSFSQ